MIVAVCTKYVEREKNNSCNKNHCNHRVKPLLSVLLFGLRLVYRQIDDDVSEKIIATEKKKKKMTKTFVYINAKQFVHSTIRTKVKSNFLTIKKKANQNGYFVMEMKVFSLLGRKETVFFF